jgi:hypothetical protein
MSQIIIIILTEHARFCYGSLYQYPQAFAREVTEKIGADFYPSSPVGGSHSHWQLEKYLGMNRISVGAAAFRSDADGWRARDRLSFPLPFHFTWNSS